MDKEEIMRKIIEVGQKCINLRDEIATNVQILSENEEYVGRLMGEIDMDEVKDPLEEVKVVKNVKNVSRFDSTKFKKAHPKVYESFRVASKTFKQKKLKEEKPELFNEFLTKEEVVSISIERYISEDSLPSL